MNDGWMRKKEQFAFLLTLTHSLSLTCVSCVVCVYILMKCVARLKSFPCDLCCMLLTPVAIT